MLNKLIFSPELIEFLDKTSGNKISTLLLNGSENSISVEGNFISRDPDKADVWTYLPKSKIKKIMVDHSNPSLGFITEPWEYLIGRVGIKVGRFVRKFLSEEAISEHGITDSEIEKFVNLHKSFFNRDGENLKIVEGGEILKWYLEDNYFLINGNIECGTLWNSCMRYMRRNKYMELYARNKNIKMLILLGDGGKLKARALLWNNVFDGDGNNYKVMDRIYTVYDHDVNLFKDWAKENGYIYKSKQNSKTENSFIVNGVETELYLSFKLDEWHFHKYPYLDTFKFFDYQRGILHNNDSFEFHFVLNNADGFLVIS